MLRFFLCIGIFLFNAVAANSQNELRKVALVIGNSSYESVADLKNPVNDASDVATALIRLGFSVTLNTNLNRDTMHASLDAFSKQAENAEIALVYYAGHGVEVGGVNFLIPVDTDSESQPYLPLSAISLKTVVDAVATSAGIKIVIIDACRDNPFGVQTANFENSRSLSRGLTRVDVSEIASGSSLIIGYAAREGTVALDGEGRNSPYAQALLEYLEEPGLEISKLFRRVRDRVFAITGSVQEPFTYGSLPGDDIFLVPASGTEEFQSALIGDFALAQRKDDVIAWNVFLDRYRELGDHSLILIGRQRLEYLKSALVEARGIASEDVWFQPVSGLFAEGELELNNAERRLIQRALMHAGFDPGSIDGILGSKSRRAIAAARLAFGLQPSTLIDAALVESLPNVVATDNLLTGEARAFGQVVLPSDVETRLRKLIDTLPNHEMVIDYFEGRLYAGVISPRIPGELVIWHTHNRLAMETGGHLATITSDAENEFIIRLLQRDSRFFSASLNGTVDGPNIGLVQSERQNEPAGGWFWVTGEELQFENWFPGQPDSNVAETVGSARFGNFVRFSRDGRVDQWGDSIGNAEHFVLEVE